MWYENRTDFSKEQIGIPLKEHKNNGFELLQGTAVFNGKIFGGCIDTLFDMYTGEWCKDSPKLCQKYGLLPDLDFWKGRILLLESSEIKMTPEQYKKALTALKNEGLFDVISGIIVGKPAEEVYYEEYKNMLLEVIDSTSLPIVYNVNIGHALPRCIIPFGAKATVDTEKQRIVFE